MSDRLPKRDEEAIVDALVGTWWQQQLVQRMLDEAVNGNQVIVNMPPQWGSLPPAAINTD